MNLQIDENADIRMVQTLIDEAKSLGMRVVHKPKQVTCKCAAYKFPHRLDSKACRELYNQSHDSGYEPDSIKSLGLVSEFAINTPEPLRW